MAKDKEYYGFIYITTNNVNGKKYIGQKKYDKEGKWKTYLGSGTALNNAIKKHGKENFSKEIVEECKTKEELDQREKYWISYYDAVKNKEFYNITHGGDGGNTIAGYSDEERSQHSKNLSKAFKGVINQGKNNPMAKKVICLNTMQIFDTTVEAGKFYNIPEGKIQKACKTEKSRVHTAGIDTETGEKLQWRYYIEDEEYTYIPYTREYPTKKVYCFENNSVYKSAKEASVILNINAVSITHCCNHHLKSTHDRHFLYYDEYIKMSDEELKPLRDASKPKAGKRNPFYGKHHNNETKKKISEKNKLIPKRLGKDNDKSVSILCVNSNTIYYSTREAERETGVDHSSIIRCCKGKQKTAGGFIWKYVSC